MFADLPYQPFDFLQGLLSVALNNVIPRRELATDSRDLKLGLTAAEIPPAHHEAPPLRGIPTALRSQARFHKYRHAARNDIAQDDIGSGVDSGRGEPSGIRPLLLPFSRKRAKGLGVRVPHGLAPGRRRHPVDDLRGGFGTAPPPPA